MQTTAQPSPSLEPVKLHAVVDLVSLCLSKVIDVALKTSDFDVKTIQPFLETLEHLTHHLAPLLEQKVDLVTSSDASVALLKIAYKDHKFLDWSCFNLMDPLSLERCLSSNELSGITGISLPCTCD